MPHQPHDLGFEGAGHFAFERARDGSVERFGPAQGPKPAEPPDRWRGEGDPVPTGRRARGAQESPHGEIQAGRPGERPAAPETPVQAETVTQELNGPERKAERGSRGPGRRLERAQRADQEPVERRVRIAIGGELIQALNHPRPLPQSLQVLAHPDEGVHDVEVVHLDQPASLGLEEEKLSLSEQLEPAPEARARPAGRLGHAPDLAELAGVEGDQAIALAERPPADHHSLGFLKGHCVASGHEHEAELLERPLIPAPVFPHFDAEGEKHLDPEEGFQLGPGR